MMELGRARKKELWIKPAQRRRYIASLGRKPVVTNGSNTIQPPQGGGTGSCVAIPAGANVSLQTIIPRAYARGYGCVIPCGDFVL